MSQTANGDTEQNHVPVVLLAGEDFLPALSGRGAPLEPSRAYLLSLKSSRSRQTMASFLGIVAGMLGATSAETCS